MKWRRVDCAGDVVERHAFTQLAGEVGLGRLGAVGVIGVRAGSTVCAAGRVARTPLPARRP